MNREALCPSCEGTLKIETTDNLAGGADVQELTCPTCHGRGVVPACACGVALRSAFERDVQGCVDCWCELVDATPEELSRAKVSKDERERLWRRGRVAKGGRTTPRKVA